MPASIVNWGVGHGQIIGIDVLGGIKGKIAIFFLSFFVGVEIFFYYFPTFHIAHFF